MGASWLEVDKLIRELDTLTEFPHADALPSVVRARDTVAETAMVVSLAGLSDAPGAEIEAQDLLARARVAILDAQLAVRRASETVALSLGGRARAKQLIEEARALRARDRSRATLTAARAATPQPVMALMRRPEPAAS
jgi:hypothetical protein